MKVSAAIVVSIAVLCGTVVTGTKLGEFFVSRPGADPPQDKPTQPPVPRRAPTLESLGGGAWGCPVPCVVIVPVNDASTGQTLHLRLCFSPDDASPGRAAVLIQVVTPNGEPVDPAKSPIAPGIPWLETAHVVVQ